MWAGNRSGINSVRISLDTDQPFQVIGPEHFHEVHHCWSCAAAPIHGINGEIIACIDISGPVELCHLHTYTLAAVAASSIENIFEKMYEKHKLELAIEGSHDCITLLNERFEIIGINHLAKSLLNIQDENYKHIDFRTIMFGVDWQEVQEDMSQKMFYYENTKIYLDKDFIDCGLYLTSSMQGHSKVYILSFKKHVQIRKLVNTFSGNTAKYTFESIFAKNSEMKKVISLAKHYAKLGGNILIVGESGTGKEMFAQAIHNASNYSNGPFVAINCASLPRELIESELFGYEKNAFTGASKAGNMGKFELANGGTLFLDEIGEMPLEFQAKLLRAVETLRIRRIGGKEERELNVRIIAATNRKLYEETQRGAFRQDLYFRLNVLEIDIPSLRQRPEDIGYCAEKFLQKHNSLLPNRQKSFSKSFLDALEGYYWPGNIRELQNCIERIFYTSDHTILDESDFLYLKVRPSQPHVFIEQASTEQVSMKQRFTCRTEKAELLVAAIEKYNGEIQHMTQALGISRATFYRLCKKNNIEPKKIVRHQNLRKNI